MARLCKDAWIEAGLQMLDSSSDSGLSIERLARRLGVTRGSFYHHFRSRKEFVTALLRRWEQTHTTDVIAYAACANNPLERLHRYVEIAGPLPSGREVALRRWADSDSAVRAALARVEAKRFEFVCELTRCFLPLAQPPTIEQLSRIGYLAFIGLQQTGRRTKEQLAGLAEDWLLVVRSGAAAQ